MSKENAPSSKQIPLVCACLRACLPALPACVFDTAGNVQTLRRCQSSAILHVRLAVAAYFSLPTLTYPQSPDWVCLFSRGPSPPPPIFVGSVGAGFFCSTSGPPFVLGPTGAPPGVQPNATARAQIRPSVPSVPKASRATDVRPRQRQEREELHQLVHGKEGGPQPWRVSEEGSNRRGRPGRTKKNRRGGTRVKTRGRR